MLKSLAPARRRLVLALLSAVVAVAVVVAVVVVRRIQSPDVVPVAQDTLGPVLLVPGYGGGTAALQTLADRLTASGRDAQVIDLPDGGTGDLNVQAKALGLAVTAALSRTGAGSVDVIGYSAGGLVARLWVLNLGGASQARRVVTLGSPHHGTEIAGLATSLAASSCPTACAQMAPDSDLLAELNDDDETPTGPVFISIWTELDQTVTPPDSAELDGALNLTVQSVCPGSTVGHGGLPTDPTVAGIVKAELAAGPTVQLTDADCARISS